MGKGRGRKPSDDGIVMLRNTRRMKGGKSENSRGDIQSKIDNLGRSPGDIVNYYSHPQINHPDATIDRTVTIPFISSRMNTDSIFYDVTLGFIFAAIFTFTVALLGIFFNWCCVCVFCPKLHRKRMRRRRIRERRKWIVREQLFSAGIQMVPLTQEYNEVPASDDGDGDSEEPKKEDEDRDQSTRMEYGQVDDNETYDDDDDYLLSKGGADNKSVGRYEEKDIEASANKYFGDSNDKNSRKGGSKHSNNRSKTSDDESVSSDSSNEACEPLLDLAAMELDLAKMEKKISDSMEKTIFI